MSTTTTTINMIAIDEARFKTLANDLVVNSIGGDGSPFNEMRTALRQELEIAEGLDAVQRAGIYSSFLKDAYRDINKQAMQTAFEILKSNEDYKLTRYKVEAEYNLAQQKLAEGIINQDILSKNSTLKDKELSLADEKIAGERMNRLETKARLHKQYGLMETTNFSIGDGTSNYTARTLADGSLEYYKTNASGALLATEDYVNQVNADNRQWNADNEDADPKKMDYVFGTMTTTEFGHAQRGSVNASSVGTTLQQVPNFQGAIDKQIAGYDKVNQKDLIKTLNELEGMLNNAQIECIPKWIAATTKELITLVEPNVVEAVSTVTDCPDE